jgi:hypothetical protein
MAVCPICLVGWIGRLGLLANLLSRPVLIGYMNGIALLMIVRQLGNLTGARRRGISHSSAAVGGNPCISSIRQLSPWAPRYSRCWPREHSARGGESRSIMIKSCSLWGRKSVRRRSSWLSGQQQKPDTIGLDKNSVTQPIRSCAKTCIRRHTTTGFERPALDV